MTSAKYSIDPAASSWVETYRRLTEVVTPRPIALVSTVDKEGRVNLAPFSFFTVISSNPPYLAFSPHRAGRTGEKKHTLLNIEEVGEFVIAVVTREIADKVNACAAGLPRGVSEFSHSGLTPIPAECVKAPLVEQSPVNLECQLVEIHSYGDQGGAGSLVVGKLVRMHIDQSVCGTDGSVIAERLDAVGRMGGDLWVTTRDSFPMERPE